MSVAVQRLQRGARISSCYPVKSLPSLASLDSAFQLQEYISLLIRLDPHDVDHIVDVPGKNAIKEREPAEEEKEAEKDGKGEVTVDEACWIYEQLRRLAQDLSHPLITVLQQECTRASCPEMKAGEWLYLCVAHGNDGSMEQCCAIDYIIHTLDSATALLNSPRAFPSRISIPQTSHRHFSSLARRLGRIFAHAYFHHRDAFAQAEAESSLYARFLALSSRFALVPAEFLVIPPRMGEDDDADGGSSGDEHSDASRPVLLVPPELGPTAIEREAAGGDDLPPAYGIEARERSPGGYMDSPRKGGRNRTDTMVFSEASLIAEELAKAEAEAEVPVETIGPVADSELKAHEDTSQTEISAVLSSSRDETPVAAEPILEPAPDHTDSEPSTVGTLHDLQAGDIQTADAVTADVSMPTAASDRMSPDGTGRQGPLTFAPFQTTSETLDDGTELTIEPAGTPDEDGTPIFPHGPESPSVIQTDDEADAERAEEPEEDVSDIDSETTHVEGGAAMSGDAVEEPLPSAPAPAPAETDAARDTTEVPALDALSEAIAVDSALPDEQPTVELAPSADVAEEEHKPSGLDAAVVAAAEASPAEPEVKDDLPAADSSEELEADRHVSTTASFEEPEEKSDVLVAASSEEPQTQDDVDPVDKAESAPTGLDAAVVDTEETKISH